MKRQTPHLKRERGFIVIITNKSNVKNLEAMDMVRKTKYEPPRKAELTPEKIRQGIVKLRRRIQELEEFDVSSIQERWDSKTKALTTKINDTLAEISTVRLRFE